MIRTAAFFVHPDRRESWSNLTPGCVARLCSRHRHRPKLNRKAVLMAANVEEETILGLPSRGKLLSSSNFSKEPMPRTLRTVLLGGGGVPPGSAVSGL